jgi:hypothetical protein
MLHVPINIRQIPSPILSPTVEQKDFIPKDDTAPIVVESISYPPLENHTAMSSPQIETPIEPPMHLQNNVVSYPVDPSSVGCGKPILKTSFN